MPVTQQKIAPLAAGDTLTWKEFERRWDAEPEIKFAELIGGKVYMPPPLSAEHSESDADVGYVLQHYALKTPGCRVGINPTLRILKDAPQPDVLLRTDEKHGGRCRVRGKYFFGAPEMVAEISLTSAAYDLHEKKDLYEQAGIDEYIAVLVHEKEVRWHRLEGGKYTLLKPNPKSVIRSIVFPGLWLNVRALLKDDMPAVLETLEAGLASAEHAAFMKELAARAG